MQNINIQSAQLQVWDNRRRPRPAATAAPTIAPVAKLSTTTDKSQYLYEPLHVGEWIQANRESYVNQPSSATLEAVPVSAHKAILAYKNNLQGKIPTGRVLNLLV